MRFISLVFACFLMLCGNATASENVKINHYTNITGNNLLEVLLEFDIAPKWHIFAPYEQEFGSPLKINWQNVSKNDVLEESYSKTKRYTQDMISFDG